MKREPLAQLRNIGPALLADFQRLGIATLEQLARSSPDELYGALQRLTRRRHDPCVWDVFAAAIHEARTGEARNWWTFTLERKVRQLRGAFPSYAPAKRVAATARRRVREPSAGR